MNNFENLQTQLEKLVNAHGSLFAEYEINHEDEFLLVHFGYNDQYKGLFLSFDLSLGQTFFSGEVIELETGIVIPFDEYFEDLDYYLQKAGEEIIEGYLIPNNLYI